MNDPKSLKSLIVAYLDGNLHGAGLDQLLHWMESSSENARFFAQVKDLWEASLRHASSFAETDKEWERFEKNVDSKLNFQKRNRLGIVRLLSGMAAVLVIGFISGLLFVKYIQQQNPVYITATAPAGSVTNLVLADSTIVYLNAGSQIRYCPDGKEHIREVTLNGEAWFDVAKNKKNPFVVHTIACDVSVKGTRFDVKAYAAENEIVTTLEEGVVVLTSTTGYRLTKPIRLLPGEQAVIDKSANKALVKKVETRYFTSWKDNKLMFINMNMKDLIVTLERKFGLEIEVSDSSILNFHYTGTLKNESVLEVMELIKHTLPIDYHIDGQVIRIIKTNKKGGK
jgi:transmembrane sensor